VDNLAFCWGGNDHGQLGDGTNFDRSRPTPVAGGLQFRQIEAGTNHTCGVTTANRAYCWGNNQYGQLGDGTTINRRRPVAVASSRQFRQVAASGEGSYLFLSHTCAVTTDNRAFCWGNNKDGQLGDSTEVAQRLIPTRVAGGHLFLQIDGGSAHTCAVTTGSRAYCWGNGRAGAIGNGQKYLSFWPRAVAGGISFRRVSAGDRHSCGETTNSRAYCWGINDYGQIGDGTAPYIRYTPAPVSGGHFFAQLSAGAGVHTCAKTSSGQAYCWGNNNHGQVGDGTTGNNRLTPVAVAGP
jgi:alpha-tubulin suppressor-like RCC1 family protein